MNCVVAALVTCDQCSIMDDTETGCRFLQGYSCAFGTSPHTLTCDCKPMCEDEEYEFTTSVASFPNDFAVSTYQFRGWPTNNGTHIERK